MADKAHTATDRKLAEMEKHLSAIYDEAQKDIEKKAAEYFAQFERLDAQKRKLVAEGKMTEEAYKKWRRGKIMNGKHWTNLKAQLAKEYANVNRTALAYVNGELPEVYSLNYNDIGASLDDQVKGYSFELVDAHTVKNLATSDQTLLPYKYLNGTKDVRWNTQKVNSAVLQGILQGESIPNLAKRLRSVTNMNKASSIRNARTAVTGAECKGRQDSYEKAEKDGIHLKREWISTIDGRTRHAHRLLDGQLADVDNPFKSELGDIMYPGDPTADPSNVYNCRCTIAAKVISIGGVKVEGSINENAEKADRKTAQDFYNENPKEFDIRQKMLYNEKADKEQFNAYKSRIGSDAPRKFSDFQDMKYRDAEKYNDFKRYYRYKGISPESDRRYYEANKAKDILKQKGEIKASGIVVKQKPIVITGKRSHAEDQMLARNITEKDVENIISGSSFALRQQNGKVFAFYSKDGFAAVDTEGVLRTVGQLDEGGEKLFKEVIKHVEDSR